VLESLKREGSRLHSLGYQTDEFRPWRDQALNQVALALDYNKDFYRRLYVALSAANAAYDNPYENKTKADIIFTVRLGDALAVLEEATDYLLNLKVRSGSGVIQRVTSWARHHRALVFWVGVLGSLASIFGVILALV